jgi:2'-5' RNA ligase
VCPAWAEYKNFVVDMGEPEGDETLDRIDTYGNYSPENCRWAGVQTQNRNIRLRANSATGYIGVSTVGKRFMAKITVGKKAHYSKVVATVEEAAAARKELERVHWGVA